MVRNSKQLDQAADALNGSTFPSDANGAANIYIDCGLAPIPIPRGRKGCELKGWQNLRIGAADLAEHFPAQHASNIGVLNGEPSGNLADVDLDCRQARRAAGLLLPATGWTFGRKSAMKSHRLYRTDQPAPKASEKFTDLDGDTLVELRGTGGQTVFPPSIHEDTGEQICWHSFTEAARVELTALRSSVAEVAAAALIAQHWPDKGSRQEAALALAGALLRAGWPQEHTETFIEAVCKAARDEEADKRIKAVAATVDKLSSGANVTGWPKLAELLTGDGDAVIERVREWLNANKAKAAAKRMLPGIAPYVPFPVDALPSPIRELSTEGAASMGCDAAYFALPALTAAAALIGNQRAVLLKRGWTEPSVLWAAAVGDSGTLKSPAAKPVFAPLYRMQKELLDSFDTERQAYAQLKDAHEAARRKAKQDNKPLDDTLPDPPTARRILAGDVTIEKLGALLAENPRGLLVKRDELAGWFASLTRYRSKGQAECSDAPHWLEFFRAEPVLIDRKTDGLSLFIDQSAVSLFGGIQPGTLARVLTLNHFESGLAARLLLAMPPRQPKCWTENEIDPATLQRWETALRKLFALQPDTDASGTPRPFLVRLTPEAKAAWIQFFDAWNLQIAESEGERAACLAKLEAYAARFALVHHVVTRLDAGTDDCDPIEPASIDAGKRLAIWFACEAERVYAVVRECDEDRQSRRLVEFIRNRGGSITVKALQRSNPGRYAVAELAVAALEALVKAGWAEWQDRPPSAKGGRPTRDCVLRSPHPPEPIDETSSELEISRKNQGLGSFVNGLVPNAAQPPAAPTADDSGVL